MVTFVDDQHVPWAALDNFFQVVAEDSLVDAGDNETIISQSRVGRVACNPAASVQVELVSEFECDVADEACGREV